jgi:uncharacterized protein
MNHYLRERYGERVQKVSIDAGFTCPNRDGSKATGGCIYCNNDSFNFSPDVSVREQIAQGIEKARKRYGAKKFIAYYQAYSNTYGTPEYLERQFSAVHEFPEVVAVSIGTRPDCVPEEALRVVAGLTATHEVWLEYGLESSRDDSLRRMNRAHTFADFRDAVLRTQGRGIRIATHLIAGLPWETSEMMLQTAADVAALPIDAVKIHNLHIVKETALEKQYSRKPFPILSLDQYAAIAAQMLELLPPQMVIMRLSAECPADLLVAPDWTNRKTEITTAIIRELQMRDSWQGKKYGASASFV